MSRWQRFLRLFKRSDGRPWRDAAREEALLLNIPGYTVLHGGTAWVLPLVVGYLEGGWIGLGIIAVVVLVLWVGLLPAMDRYYLARSIARSDVPHGEARLLATVANRVTRPLGGVLLATMGPALVLVMIFEGPTWRGLGWIFYAFFLSHIVIYCAGEFLWDRHIGVGTRLRVYERRYDVLETAFEKEMTVSQFRDLARLKVGEKYQRSYAWTGRRRWQQGQ